MRFRDYRQKDDWQKDRSRLKQNRHRWSRALHNIIYPAALISFIISGCHSAMSRQIKLYLTNAFVLRNECWQALHLSAFIFKIFNVTHQSKFIWFFYLFIYPCVHSKLSLAMKWGIKVLIHIINRPTGIEITALCLCVWDMPKWRLLRFHLDKTTFVKVYNQSWDRRHGMSSCHSWRADTDSITKVSASHYTAIPFSDWITNSMKHA